MAREGICNLYRWGDTVSMKRSSRCVCNEKNVTKTVYGWKYLRSQHIHAKSFACSCAEVNDIDVTPKSVPRPEKKSKLLCLILINRWNGVRTGDNWDTLFKAVYENGRLAKYWLKRAASYDLRYNLPASHHSCRRHSYVIHPGIARRTIASGTVENAALAYLTLVWNTMGGA